jgi:hypothetical protein
LHGRNTRRAAEFSCRRSVCFAIQTRSLSIASVVTPFVTRVRSTKFLAASQLCFVDIDDGRLSVCIPRCEVCGRSAICEPAPRARAFPGASRRGTKWRTDRAHDICRACSLASTRGLCTSVLPGETAEDWHTDLAGPDDLVVEVNGYYAFEGFSVFVHKTVRVPPHHDMMNRRAPTGTLRCTSADGSERELHEFQARSSRGPEASGPMSAFTRVRQHHLCAEELASLHPRLTSGLRPSRCPSGTSNLRA